MRRAIAGCTAILLMFCAATAQGARYDSNEVIVRYADGVSTAQRVALFDRSGVAKTLGPVAGVGAKVVKVAGDPAAVAARLNRSSLVRYAEPNLILRTQAIPNDSRFGELYGLDNTGQTGGSADADIDAPEGWDAPARRFPAAGGVRIGTSTPASTRPTPTSAARRSLRALAGPAAPVGLDRGRQCVDDNDHGTHVAGTIAARRTTASAWPAWRSTRTWSVCKALGGPPAAARPPTWPTASTGSARRAPGLSR